MNITCRLPCYTDLPRIGASHWLKTGPSTACTPTEATLQNLCDTLPWPRSMPVIIGTVCVCREHWWLPTSRKRWRVETRLTTASVFRLPSRFLTNRGNRSRCMSVPCTRILSVCLPSATFIIWEWATPTWNLKRQRNIPSDWLGADNRSDSRISFRWPSTDISTRWATRSSPSQALMYGRCRTTGKWTSREWMLLWLRPFLWEETSTCTCRATTPGRRRLMWPKKMPRTTSTSCLTFPNTTEMHRLPSKCLGSVWDIHWIWWASDISWHKTFLPMK